MSYICKFCDNQVKSTCFLVCKNCEQFNDIKSKYESLIYKDLINKITYYLSIEDTINIYKSGIYNDIKTKSYWVNRLQFTLPNIKKCYIYEVIMNFYNFSNLLDMLYCKNINKYMYINYKHIVSTGNNIIKGKNAEVTYYIHTPIHEGFCCVEMYGEDIDEMSIIYNINIISDSEDEYIFEKDSERCGKDYGRCNGEIIYKIKSIKYTIE